jgi:hypothetical protein
MQTILPALALTRWLHPQSRRVHQRHELAHRKVLTATFPECGRIFCTQGSLWITRDGDKTDILLDDGDSLACPRHARVVIEALEASVVEITR